MSLISQVLLNGAAANAVGSTLPISYSGRLGIYVTGTFDGNTVVIEASMDGTTWYDLGLAITAAGFHTVNVVATYIRANNNGGTTPSVNVEVAFARR